MHIPCQCRSQQLVCSTPRLLYGSDQHYCTTRIRCMVNDIRLGSSLFNTWPASTRLDPASCFTSNFIWTSAAWQNASPDSVCVCVHVRVCVCVCVHVCIQDLANSLYPSNTIVYDIQPIPVGTDWKMLSHLLHMPAREWHYLIQPSTHSSVEQ